jgi:hypothetical protein
VPVTAPEVDWLPLSVDPPEPPPVLGLEPPPPPPPEAGLELAEPIGEEPPGALALPPCPAGLDGGASAVGEPVAAVGEASTATWLSCFAAARPLPPRAEPLVATGPAVTAAPAVSVGDVTEPAPGVLGPVAALSSPPMLMPASGQSLKAWNETSNTKATTAAATSAVLDTAPAR